MTLDIHGLVLAGGYSRRMGRDKALIEYHGVPQGRRAYDLLAEVCSEVHVSCRPGQFDGTPLEGLPELHDETPDQGPLGGLVTAMHLKPDVMWCMLACDLPYAERDLLDQLLSQHDARAVATCYRDPESGLPEPMCALYPPAFLPYLETRLEEGFYCARKVLILLEEQLQLLDLPRADALCNVNAPDDWPPVQEAVE